VSLLQKIQDYRDEHPDAEAPEIAEAIGEREARVRAGLTELASGPPPKEGVQGPREEAASEEE
jgi:hypothetical protein